MTGYRGGLDLSTAAVDYLQRTGIQPFALLPAGVTSAPFSLRRMLRIEGIGCLRKPRPPEARSYADSRLPPLPTESLLIGLSAYKIPLAFLIEGHPAGVSICFGTWSPSERETASSGVLEERRDILATLLRSLYPTVDVTPVEEFRSGWTLGGLVLGVPTVPTPDPLDGGVALDRLVRAMVGERWAALVIAEPLDDEPIANLRHQVVNEMRAAKAAALSSKAPSPLEEHYSLLLKAALDGFTLAQATGGWRTGVYLLGEPESYFRLASVWRALYSGDRSLPEPVRVFDGQAAVGLAEDWAMPDAPAPPGSGTFSHPFGCQTFLSSMQLSAYVHLPALEVPGFTVQIVPSFDVTPPPVDGGPAQSKSTVALGSVVHRGRPTDRQYHVRLRNLTRHLFIAGITGAGKTNTIFHLLKQAAAAGVSFMVIEPVKTEYRALAADPALANLRIFTLGDERVSPYRLNPFEVLPGVAVSEHLDLLRSVFTASFGMWTPLPQVLERCLHEIYRDRGWDLATNTNARLGDGDDATAAFPTLTDLISKVQEVVPTLGYEERITGDIRAALVTRLTGLAAGSKGRMLNVSRSLPLDDLLRHHTVLELESVADDDDKAFLMGLLFTRLAEYRRTEGEAEDLRHLLVIEEAHRLLGRAAGRTSEEQADPRGKAVETFSNLLSEIRAYGEGVIIADQIPARLAPDVVKNTSLKVAHRVVATDDRQALAGAMAMDDDQARALTVLAVGEAAVHGDGDDAPLLVRVPASKESAGAGATDDASVLERMRRWRESSNASGLFLSNTFCLETCAGAPEACQVARELVGDAFVQRTLARVVLSSIEDAAALDRLWEDLVTAVRARRPKHIDEAALLRAISGHGADWYASRRGTQAHWTYESTKGLSDLLRTVLLEKARDSTTVQDDPSARQIFRARFLELHGRTYPPYPVCDVVCDQVPAVCLYRHAVADLVAGGHYHGSWRQADVADAESPEGRRQQTWQVCQDAGYELIEFPEDDWEPDRRDRVTAAARRACLCFQQQMLADDTRKVPRTARRIAAKVMAEAGL